MRLDIVDKKLLKERVAHAQKFPQHISCLQLQQPVPEMSTHIMLVTY